MAASYGQQQSLSSPVVVLLLGETQSGKSSAGNSILGRRAFQKSTTLSSREDGTIFGKQVTVVDTPGWFSDTATPDRVSQELCRGLTLCHPEPHAILLVLPTTSVFGKEEWRAAEDQLRLLQTPIWQRAIILFTHGDKLGGLSIEEHIRQQGQTLHWLLERCGKRYQVMTNQPIASEAQVTELFRKIQRMMETNNRSKEIQNMLYTKLRQDVCLQEEMSLQGRQEELEMTVMNAVHDGRPTQMQRMASGRHKFPSESTAEPFGSKPALAFVLLGRSKSGKSSAGNIILEKDEFQLLQYGRTTRCSARHGMVLKQPVTVVDTPGWSVFGMANAKEIKKEINRSPSLCPEGSKVTFLLAIPVDKFVKGDRRAVEEFVSTLRGDVWRSTVVLFTYGEELRGKTVEKHIEEMGEPLQEVLRKCGHRYVVFDTERGDVNQVKQLLEIVEQM
uniref:GTPase IMAP family member 9-like n=1 Tax=Semicossyphus pulcher TaxID=241346 RepID=UPI0037E82822